MKSTIIFATLAATAFSAPTVRRQTGGNLQTFSAALGGVAATPVTNSGDAKRPFDVKGDTFVNLSAALARSCDQQFNACANKANGGDKTVSVAACTTQQTQCNSSAKSAKAATPAAAQANTKTTGSANAKASANANANTAANANANTAANANAKAGVNANAKAGANAKKGGKANANKGGKANANKGGKANANKGNAAAAKAGANGAAAAKAQ